MRPSSNAILSGLPFGIRLGAPSRIAKPQSNAGDSAFYYPSDRPLYGSGCGHEEKAERDFAAHRIDEDGY
jgi:hypothetical protein